MKLRKTLISFLAAFLAVMSFPRANADESGITVLVQGRVDESPYAGYARSSYTPEDGDPVWLLEFANMNEAEGVLAYFSDAAAEINSPVSKGGETELPKAEGDPLSRLNELMRAGSSEYAVAVIGNGTDGNTSASVSLTDSISESNDEDVQLLEENGVPSVLSIQAFDENGISDCATVYAALMYAVSAEVEAVILPLHEETIEAHPVIQSAVQYAADHSISVYGSASQYLSQKRGSSEIATFEASFRSGAAYDETEEKYVWKPKTSAADQRFTYRVSYSLNGVYDLDADTVKITVPLHILKTREGMSGDFFEMSLPPLEEAREEDTFAYRIAEGQIEIFNRKGISGASEGFFEVSYVTEEETFSYRDGSYSESFDTVIQIDNGQMTEQASDTVDPFRIDTSAEILSTVKRYPEKCDLWNPLWMNDAELHEDEEYLIWEIRSYITQNSTQPYTLVFDDLISSEQTETRIIGYRYMGCSEFVKENSVTHQTSDQLRTDYVLSAHKRSDADLTEITNQITVTLIPEDGKDEITTASSNAVWQEERAVFHEPAGNLGSEKYAGDTLYSLELLQQNKADRISGLNYHIIMEGYPYEWTRPKDSDPLDPSSYGIQKVKYILTDEEMYLNGEDNRLSEGDYSIDSLAFDFEFGDAFFNEESQCFEETPVTFDPEDTISFYGLFEGEWQRFAVMSLFTGTNTCSSALAQMNDSAITFLRECSGIRIETENAHFHTRALFDLSVSLNNTDHVSQLIQDQDRVTLTNSETFSFERMGEVITSLNRQASNFIRRTFRDSDLKKRVAGSSNDISQKQYTVTWKVSLQEFITGTDGMKKPYPQQSGIFYDLLPAGSEFDPASVHVMSGNRELDSSQYEFNTVENFRSSGRTLLTVKIAQQADDYALFYDTMHSWESIRDYGPSLLNPVAYETGNEDIADGSCDDGKGLSDFNRKYLSHLDMLCNTDRFVYTEQPHDITAITSAIAGLRKKVKGGGIRYSYEDVTSPGDIYSYQLRYETSADSGASDMIFFDSLENYVSEQGRTSDWHGTPESIDLSQLIMKGIDPKVYISTVSDLDIESHHDLSDSSVWTCDFTDLSEAKAVAVDMSKGADGNAYELGPSQSVSVTLFMRAPASGNMDPSANKAFNNVWLSGSLHGSFNEEEEYLIRQDYTAIELRDQADISLRKVNEADPHEPIRGISFLLEGTSDYGKSVSVVKTTDAEGRLGFTGIERGTYRLQETGNDPDWLRSETVHTVVIDGASDVWIDETLCTDSVFVITNRKRVHADLTLEKHDLTRRDKPVQGAVYRLAGTSLHGTDTVLYTETSADGKGYFKDLEPGTYTLYETEAPEDYIKDSTVHTVVLNEEGTFRIDSCDMDEEDSFILYNEPLHELKLIKQSAYDGSALSGAVFLLKGVSDDGTEVHETLTSKMGGVISCEGLRAGTYTLMETEPPEGFLKDQTVHAIRINHDGTVECDDLEKNSSGIPVILNQPSRNKTIRIIKKWIDDGNTERPIPLIHLSSQKPNAGSRTLTIDMDRWMDEDTDLPVIAEGIWFEENTDLTLEEVLANDGVIRIDDEETDARMYIWPLDDGYAWWSDADVIQLPEDCSNMFAACTELETLDLSRFSSDNVTDMNGMFINCFSLTELDLNHLDTSQVTDMGDMFNYCQSLTYLDLSGLDVSNVVAMNSMFIFCSSLTSLDLSSFDTASVERMDSMFASCSKLSSIYVSDLWSTESVYSGRDMFKNCRKLPGYNKSRTDVSYAHYGDGGYLTYREYEAASSVHKTWLMDNLISVVNAEEVQEYCSESANFITSSTGAGERELLMNSEEGYWQVLDENTWVYTFPVINDQDEFWFYEEPLEGWMTNADIYHPGSVEDQCGTIINFRGVNPESTEMNITKDVLNEINESRKFRFTITLRNEKGEPIHGRSVYGDTAFENGVAHVLIAGGETYRINGIPIGYFYLVEEEQSEGYSITSTGASGVIMDEKTTVHFINTREENEEKTVSIRLTKRLSGRYEDMDEEEFVFHFFLGGLEPRKEYLLSDGQIYFADENGGADFSYRLKEDESVELYDIPSGATYQVCEEGGDYLASYEITAGDDQENLICPAKVNSSRDRFLSTALETAGESDVQITFTNRFEYVQNITVQKICTYPDDEEEFEFTAEFHGLEEKDVIETEAGSLTPDPEGNIRRTFFLRDGESMTFKNVPVTVTYMFTEEACNWIGEYRIEDLYGRGKVVKQFGSSNEAHTPLSTKEETVNQFEDVLITFTNSPEPVSLNIAKEVKGNLGSKDTAFSFVVSLSEDGMSLSEADYEKTEEGMLKEAGTLHMDSAGRASFELRNGENLRIKNLEPGTVFTIEEDPSRAQGYVCEVIHGNEREEGYFVAGKLSRDPSDNSFTFINERNAVIPTGRAHMINSTAFCLLILLAGVLYRLV